MRALQMIAAMTLLVSGPALAATCVATPNVQDEKLGEVGLGASVEEARANAKLKPCSASPQCIVQDDMGMLYESADGVTIDSKILPAIAGAAPFGLVAGDSIVAYTAKVFPKTGANVMIWQRNPANVLVMSDPCYINSKGVVFHVAAFFDGDGGLTSFGTFTQERGQDIIDFRNATIGPKN